MNITFDPQHDFCLINTAAKLMPSNEAKNPRVERLTRPFRALSGCKDRLKLKGGSIQRIKREIITSIQHP